MADASDLAFAKALIARQKISAKQSADLLQIQSVLLGHSIRKSAAEIAVECNWISRDEAAALQPGTKIPATVRSTPELETALKRLDQGGGIDANRQKQLRMLQHSLGPLGYPRTPGELAVDLGILRPPVTTHPKPKTTRRVPGAGQPPRTARRQAGPAGNRKMLIFGGIGAAAVVVVIALATMGGSKAPADTPTETPIARTNSPTPRPSSPRPTGTTEPAASASPSAASRQAEGDCDSFFFMAQSHAGAGKIDEALVLLDKIIHEYATTKYYREHQAEIEELAAKLKKEKADPGATPGASEPPKDRTALRTAWEKRRSAWAPEGRRHVEDAVKEVEAAKAAETAKLAAQLKRLADKKLSIKLKNGQQLDTITVLGLTRDAVRMKFSIDGGEAETEYGLEMIDDRSFMAMLRAMFGTDSAEGLYEIGRACLLRKLWKEAKSAYEACVKLDASYKDKVPDLSKVLNNQAAFKGRATRGGPGVLVLAYDFSDADQAEDFVMVQPGKLEIAGGTASLSSPSMGLWACKDVQFDRELSFEMKAVIPTGTSLVIGCMMDGHLKGYLLFCSDEGTAFAVTDGEHLAEPKNRNGAGKVSGDVDFRFKVKDGKFSITSNGAEVFSGVDNTSTKGFFFVGAMGKSPIVMKKLVLSGRVPPAELDKRFAEAEIIARRAIEGDLVQKQHADRGSRGSRPELTVEDEYFVSMLSEELRDEYNDCLKEMDRFSRQGAARSDVLAEVMTGLGKVIDACPGFPAARYYRALLHEFKGDWREARKDMVEAAKHPDFPEARLRLAMQQYDAYDLAGALKTVEDALLMKPDEPRAVDLRARIRSCLQGDAKLWTRDFEVALRLDPSDEGIRHHQRNAINTNRGPEYLGCKHKMETKHFIVLTDISPAATKLYAERLEAAFKHYGELFKDNFRDDLSRPKARIAIFNTREAFYTYSELTSEDRNEEAAGYFSLWNNQLLLFDDVDATETLETLYHELFHKFMSLMIRDPRIPYWYNEGIAEYMSGMLIDNGKVVERARIMNGRLNDLQPYLKDALGFADIMNQSPEEFYSGDMSYKYAQAWSMLHFLYEAGGGKHRGLIENYFKALFAGKDIHEAFDEVFRPLNLKDLQSEWAAYVKAMQPRKSKQ